MTTARLMIICLMIGLLAFCLGCDDAKDAINNIPNPGDDPAVELVKTEGVQMATALVGVLPDMLGGGIGVKTIENAYFDESCTCWYWGDSEGSESGNTYWSRMANYRATFYAGETAQRELEGADKVMVNMSFYYEWSEYQNESYSSKSVMINLDLETTGLDTKTTLVTTGTGTGYVSGGTGNYEDEEWDGFYEEFTPEVDLTVPIPGCPTGSVDLVAEEASFDMNFDGTATASWAYSFGGNTFDSGTFPLVCNLTPQ